MIDWKLFNDTFEAEINAQEFEIDEAEWAGLLKALKKAEDAVSGMVATDQEANMSLSNPSNLPPKDRDSLASLFSQLDDLYQPEITDLERNDYQDNNQPVVYLNDVKSVLKANDCRHLSTKEMLDKLPKKKKPSNDEFLAYDHGYNKAIDDVRAALTREEKEHE